MKAGLRIFVFILIGLVAAANGSEAINSDSVYYPDSQQAADNTLQLNLSKCIEIALQSNKRSKVSQADVEIALSKHKQALSSWWPELSARLVGSRLDQSPNFIFPSSMVHLAPSQLMLPDTTITLPANAFAPGFPPRDVSLPIPSMAIDVPEQNIEVPEQNIKLMDRDILTGSVNVTYPIYTGGLRSSLIEMAKQGIEVAHQDERRTDQEVIYDVRRVYYAGVLTQRLVQIAGDTLERMEATLELTEKLYQTGSGTVKKTDYLRNKSMVETIRSMVAELESTEKTALATLITVIGLDWNQKIELMDEEIPFNPGESDPETLVSRAFHNSPQIAKLEAAVKAAQAEVTKARSGHIPKLGFFGTANKIWNSFDAGMVTPENKFTWAVGIGLEIPIFQGFRVNAEQREARAKLQKRQRQLALLRDGLALEVKQTCYAVKKSQEQRESSREAMVSATENRELNVRAYQEELVETQDVIEAQIMEALLEGQHQKVLYDHIAAQAKLDFVVGVDVDQLVNRVD